MMTTNLFFFEKTSCGESVKELAALTGLVWVGSECVVV
jgi:hypothetical protein